MAAKKLQPDTRTKATLKNLAEWGATRDEAAAWLEVSRPTLWKFLNEYPEINEAFEAGFDKARATLRRLQWNAAKKGNVTMLIWLGKQMLKQYDQPPKEDEVTREHIEALRLEIERKLARVLESETEAKLASEPNTD